jgi:hypothetical protein
MTSDKAEFAREALGELLRLELVGATPGTIIQPYRLENIARQAWDAAEAMSAEQLRRNSGPVAVALDYAP